MSNIIRCCFAGHSDLYDRIVVSEIKKAAEKLVTKCGVNEFWVGNYGDFDTCSVTAIKELKKSYPHITIDLVIPYLTKSINEYRELYYEKYDHILMANVPENTPKRFYITKSNEYMVDNCDFMICYIQKNWGGAYRTYMYAERKGLKIFNVAKVM